MRIRIHSPDLPQFLQVPSLQSPPLDRRVRLRRIQVCLLDNLGIKLALVIFILSLYQGPPTSFSLAKFSINLSLLLPFNSREPLSRPLRFRWINSSFLQCCEAGAEPFRLEPSFRNLEFFTTLNKAFEAVDEHSLSRELQLEGFQKSEADLKNASSASVID